MSEPSKPSFQAVAVASRLVTREQLDQAREALRAEAAATADPNNAKVTARMLAIRLIETGLINQWQAEQLLAGRTKFTLGIYRILDSIGHGGMGQVFKGEHPMMGRVVAIKVLPRSKCTPDSLANFMREIRAQAQLDHENLVRAYDAGVDGNVHFLVTEYVPGTDLRRLIRRNGKLSMGNAASIISQAARGLEHAHHRGLIHRDVKPGNVLVTPEGRTKVSDLGLAGYFTSDEPEEGDPEREGKIVGTADYLSPEQILTPDNLTPACDIYALGCTLYYAVTGKVPFPGGTTQDKARKHCREQPLDPRRLNPDLSEDFVESIFVMMKKDPQERIQSAAAVAELLTPWACTAAELTAAGPSDWAPMSRRTDFITSIPDADAEDVGDTRPMMDSGGDLVLPEEESEQLSQISHISQLSQRTMSLAGSGEETLPMFEHFMRPAPSPGLSPGVLVLIVIGLGTAVGILGAIFILSML